MKAQNYYELLGVAPHVGSGQVQAAYRFARTLYSGEATPTYGLLDADERAQMLALVEEAYAVLSNPSARRDYDILVAQQTQLRPTVAPGDESPQAPPPPSRARARGAEEAPPPAILQDPPIAVTKVPEFVNGAALRTLREARNLSIDQIAALSKIGSRFLKALEEDRHQALPGRVFARGFLIEYARALHASETELVDRYLRNWAGK